MGAVSPETMSLVIDGGGSKGDVLGVAELAGVMGGKRTSELIPLCHPLPLTDLVVAITPDRAAGVLRIRAEAATTGQTGVEMEAMTAASVAALTVYDMVKGVERGVGDPRRSTDLEDGRQERDLGPLSRPGRRPADPATRRSHGRPDRLEAEGKRMTEGAVRSALVITASDGAAAGAREDASGAGVGERLERLGYAVERLVVSDDRAAIELALVEGTARHPFVVTTGGTGLTPRDVTPQATLAVIDYEVPGLAEAMRAAGRAKTPFADLSRGVAGVRGRSLIVNLPGSPKGALESLEAIAGVLEHALDTLAGPYDHRVTPTDSTTASTRDPDR